MSKAARMEKQLPVADRLARLRALVENLPDGDRDREDLMLLFSEVQRVKKANTKLSGRLRGARICREDNRRLRGALSLAKYALELANKKAAEQEVTIDWLRRRVGRNKLEPYEREQLQALANEQRLNDGETVRDESG